MESNTKNFALVLTSQGVSTLVSILRSLILPLFLTVTYFGYFQSYLLYITYAPFFCLGYNDGVYLRYGNINYQELPFTLLAKSNALFFILLSIFAVLIWFVGYLFVNDSDIRFALNMSSLYMITLGVNTLIMQIYQITMNFKGYSLMSIWARVLSLVFIVAILLLGIVDYKYVIVLDLLSLVLITIYLVFRNNKLFVFTGNPFCADARREFYECIKSGLPLMVAGIMGMLILGTGQFALQFRSSIEDFAQYRFGISISSFVLMAVSSASLIIYPVLKRMDEERQKSLYTEMSNTIDLSILLIIPIYYAGLIMIRLFYTQYNGLLDYMAVLLVIVFYQAKIYIVQNSYYKTLRLEKELFIDNLISLIVIFILLVTVFTFFNQAKVVAVISLLAIFVRYVISEIRLSRIIGSTSNILQSEILLLVVFMLVTMFFDLYIGLAINIIMTNVYIITKRKIIVSTINKYVKRNSN